MKRIVIILSSVFLLVLSFLSINKKIIQPIKYNKNYEKELAKFEQELVNKKNEYDKKKEEELKEIQETEYVQIELPEDEEKICRSVIGMFFHSINMKDYETAYKMLDERFKANYFQDLETFKLYCEEKYAEFKVIDYIKYERRSDYILVKINVKDLDNYDNKEELQINIAEKGNYIYTISFGIEG